MERSRSNRRLRGRCDEPVQPREVNVAEVRAVLREQGAHLTDDAAVAAASQAEAAE